MRRRGGPTRHHARIDPQLTDPRTGMEYCADAPQGCGLPRDHPIHDVPETQTEQRIHEARLLGEGHDAD